MFQKTIRISLALAFIFSILSVAGVANADVQNTGKTVKRRLGKFQVVIQIDKKRPTVDESVDFFVTVNSKHDHETTPVSDASVNLEVGKHDEATEVSTSHDDEHAGTYRGTITFSHKGTQRIKVTVASAENEAHPKSFTFTISVRAPSHD